jgi:hypothetical protein
MKHIEITMEEEKDYSESINKDKLGCIQIVSETFNISMT